MTADNQEFVQQPPRTDFSSFTTPANACVFTPNIYSTSLPNRQSRHTKTELCTGSISSVSRSSSPSYRHKTRFHSRLHHAGNVAGRAHHYSAFDCSDTPSPTSTTRSPSFRCVNRPHSLLHHAGNAVGRFHHSSACDDPELHQQTRHDTIDLCSNTPLSTSSTRSPSFR